ncbi:septum site-determining protein MinC [Laceyella putida]|jgi:septum site-determining protein MinC|uniref:Probable septum site-determining protein MinC n=1 Tax=Laceyella putida TaxID=110101 RepID=A0ABW2RIS8_9BACL
MGKVMKPGVTIKGNKDGLLFILDDSRPFSYVLEELKHKLENTQAAQIWDGPDMKVTIKLGQRQITRTEELAVRELFSIRQNLIVHAFESEGMTYLRGAETDLQIKAGTVRSGQVLVHSGNLLFLGDVNPGGTIQCTGSIYVLGALRGLAHAGSQGDQHAVIVASTLRPTQLRIADVISRPPDRWDDSEVGMRFAYMADNQIIVEKISQLGQLRPELEWNESRRRLNL